MSQPSAGPAAASTPGTRRYPASTTVQVAGIALVNTTMAGPSNPTQPVVRPRPDAATLQVGVPDSEPEVVRLAQLHASKIEQSIGLTVDASIPGQAKSARDSGRRSLMHSAGKALSKVGRRLGRQVLGTEQPAVPTIADVLAIGRRKTVVRPASVTAANAAMEDRAKWQTRTEALLRDHKHAVVRTARETYHLRTVEAYADTVSRLNDHAQGKLDQRLEGLVSHVTEQTRLDGECAAARGCLAQAEADVARHFQSLENARSAHALVTESCAALHRRAKLAGVRQEAILKALENPAGARATHSGAEMPLQDQVHQARARLETLEGKLGEIVQRQVQAQNRADAMHSYAALDDSQVRQTSRRRSPLEQERALCRQELAAARARMVGLEEALSDIHAPSASSRQASADPSGANLRLEEARAEVAGLQRWNDELPDGDLAGQSLDILSSAIGIGPVESASQLAQEEADHRAAWADAGAHLAQLEVQQLLACSGSSATQSTAQPASTAAFPWQSRPAIDPFVRDRVALLKQSAIEVSEELKDTHFELARMQASLVETRMVQQECSHSLEAAVSALPQAQTNVAGAEAALRQHKERLLTTLETAGQTAAAVEQALDRSKIGNVAMARKLGSLGAEAREIGEAAVATQRGSMNSLIAAPPGFTAPGHAAVILHDVLIQLQNRLLEKMQPEPGMAMSADTMLELAIRSAARVAEDDPVLAARALSSLADLPLQDLVARPDATGIAVNAPPLTSLATTLAKEVATLPRGMEVLQALAKPSPTPLDKERMTGIQIYLLTGAELAQNEGLDAQARDWITHAQAGAAARVHGLDGRIEVHRDRVAYNGVRNGFMTDGPGSPYDQADQFMRSVTERMLDHAVQAGSASLARRAARVVMPVDQPTPFNQPALTAAGKAAAAVGIVDRLPQAVQQLATATDRLRAALVAVPQPPATELFALMDELQEQFTSPRHRLPGTPSPLEAARALLGRVHIPPSATADLQQFTAALDRADAALFMAAPRIQSRDDVVSFFSTLLSNIQLRDRLKITGGSVWGATTAGLTATENFLPTIVQGRVDLRRTQQKDEVLEVFLAANAIQLLIGDQTTTVSRGGIGGGVGLGFLGGAVVARPIDAEWRITKEAQSQTGVMLRVPRGNTTEKTDLAGIKAAITDMLKWRDATRPDGSSTGGPLEVVLSQHSQVSVNLLGDYDRQTIRRETIRQSGGSVGVPFVPLLRFSAAWAAGHRNQSMNTQAKENTGFYRFQEQRKNIQLVRQSGVGAGVGVPLLSALDSSPAGATASVLRAQKMFDTKTRGIEKIIRLTTMDGALMPYMCRYTVEHTGAAAFVKDVRDNWEFWVNRGVQYNEYPEDWPNHLRQQDAERELEGFLTQVEAEVNEFMVCQVVHAVCDDAAPRIDALRALMETARRSGDAVELARHEKMLDAVLEDPTTWFIGRLVLTERSNRTEQLGLALGAVAQSSSVADASHAVLTYPNFPAI